MSGKRNLHVLLLAGGRSAEHPISLRSAATVLDGLVKSGYRTTLVGVTRDGLWVHGDLKPQLEKARTAILDLDPSGTTPVALVWDAAPLP